MLILLDRGQATLESRSGLEKLEPSGLGHAIEVHADHEFSSKNHGHELVVPCDLFICILGFEQLPTYKQGSHPFPSDWLKDIAIL